MTLAKQFLKFRVLKYRKKGRENFEHLLIISHSEYSVMLLLIH